MSIIATLPDDLEEFTPPRSINIEEVDNGWIISYYDEGHRKHVLICSDQYEVMYWLQKLLCPPTPRSVPNIDLQRGPFR